MEIKDYKSEDIVLFFENLDELLNSVKEAFKNNSSTLNGERFLINNDVSDMLHIFNVLYKIGETQVKLPISRLEEKYCIRKVMFWNY